MGLRRVLEQHNVNAKIRNDILHEASRLVANYHQLVDHLLRQKQQLEKVNKSIMFFMCEHGFHKIIFAA